MTRARSPRCGTLAGYEAHLLRDEDVCTRCARAKENQDRLRGVRPSAPIKTDDPVRDQNFRVLSEHWRAVHEAENWEGPKWGAKRRAREGGE